MKKSIFIVVAVVAITAGVVGFFNQSNKRDMSALTLANVEALTIDEDGTQCPDANYVPNHYIEAQSFYVTVTCNKKGELSIGNNLLHGSYEKGHDYYVIIEELNCSGMQDGACCDQRQVGTRIVG